MTVPKLVTTGLTTALAMTVTTFVRNSWSAQRSVYWRYRFRCHRSGVSLCVVPPLGAPCVVVSHTPPVSPQFSFTVVVNIDFYFPQFFQLLQEGKTHVSSIALCANRVTQANQKMLFEFLPGKSSRELRFYLSRLTNACQRADKPETISVQMDLDRPGQFTRLYCLQLE